MFTVKVRAADGVESLYSAETINVIGGPNETRYIADERTVAGPLKRDMYQEGIYLDRKVQLTALGEEPFYTSKHVIQFGGDETSDRQARRGGKVWVMNAYGSTVATYDL